MANIGNLKSQQGPDLHNLLRINTHNLMLFAYVQGARRANPEVKISTAIDDFLNYFDSDMDYSAARTAYYSTLNKTLGK